MAIFNLINDWLDNLHESADVAGDQFMIALSNTAPGAEVPPPTGDGAGVLANVTEVAYTWLSGQNITTTSSSQTAGTYALILADITLTSTGGATGPFRYVYVYDDTPISPTDPLVCYYDYGSPLTLNDGESLNVDFDNANGLYQVV